MLMNGKEVNHLVIGGETFDKSYFMRKVRLVKDVNTRKGAINMDGVFWGDYTGGVTIPSGAEGIVFFKYKNGYCIYSEYHPEDYFHYAFWVTEDCIEFIDDDKTGDK